MQVLFKSRHLQATALRDLTERRVRFVLQRLSFARATGRGAKVGRNSPRGGVDKRCQVELKTDGAGSVVVAADGDIGDAEIEWLHRLAVHQQLGLARGALLALLDTFCENLLSSDQLKWAERPS